jgi:hypothetical protein
MSSKQIHCHSPSGFRCEATHPNHDIADQPNVALEAAGDPATLIGLALSFARQGALFSGKVPSLILERLALHAGHGNPTCRLVLDWLAHHHRMEPVMIPEKQVSRSRRSAHDRIMQALASVPQPTPEVLPLRHSRKRREPLAEIMSATARKVEGEASHG